MKPVVIYTTYRTRGTAAMQACLREHKMFEPFGIYNTFDLINGTTHLNRDALLSKVDKSIYSLPYEYYNKLTDKNIHQLTQKLNDPDTVSKIISTDLIFSLAGRKWIESINDNTHDIFILARDRRESLFSILLARVFGFYKHEEKEPYNITVSEDLFISLKATLDSFLRFLPISGTLITFDDLPSTHFDKSLIKIENQDSLSKLSYITNLDFCEYHMDQLIKFYDDEWNSKLSKLKKYSSV